MINAPGNTISGSPYLEDSHIYGGYSGIESGNAFTGNTFNLQSSGIFIKDIGNFEYYNFALPENIVAGEVMLTVKETVDLAETTITISLQGISKLQKNDKIVLIISENSIKNAPINRSCTIVQSGSLYEFSIHSNTRSLWAEVTSVNTAK